MSFAVSLSQLLLAVVFAVAGVAKLADRSGTRAAIEAFGVSPRLAPGGAVLLPIKLEGLTESIASDENYLRNQTKPAARKRLKRAIARAIRERAKAQREVDFCNALFLEDRAKGEAKCIAPSPPGGGSGGSGTGGSAGCEPGYLLCNDYCCDTNIAYCQGCKGNVICCRIEGNCCPSSA